MSKKIIIDWQRDSLIVSVGHVQGGKLTIEQISEQPIGKSSATAVDTLPINGDAAQGLVRAIDELGLRKSDVSVILSRDCVEVRTIAIPRIDVTELADVIRFQAQRQLANMGDAWVLDYVLLPDAPGQEMLTALVGAIAPATLHAIESACDQAGVTLEHVALRPIEIARFATASGSLSAEEPSLVVCVSDQQADLLILERGRIVQVRSTKLPSDEAHLQSTLSGELRRSLMAAAPHLSNQSIKQALLIARPQRVESLLERLAVMLECPIAQIDPGVLLSKTIPEREAFVNSFAHRLVGMAGSLQWDSALSESRIDFKNPKKRPPPKNHTRTYALAGCGALLVALGIFAWWFTVQSDLDAQLADLQLEKESRLATVETAQERIAQVQEIDRFLQASPNWLDELHYMAEKMPPSDKVLMGEPAFTVLADGSGRVTMPVAVDSSPTIGVFENSLRDDQHVVAGRNSNQLNAASGELYKWRVDESITIRDRGWKLIPQLDTSRSAGQSASTATTNNPATIPTPTPAPTTNES